MTFLERARQFVAGPNLKNQAMLLRDCIADGGVNALAAVQLIAEDMYDNITFNREFKEGAAWSLCCWGSQGLDALIEMATRTPTLKNRNLCIEILSKLSGGAASPGFLFATLDTDLRNTIQEAIANNSNLKREAKQWLAAYILSFDDDADAVGIVGNLFAFAQFRMDENLEASRAAFGALALRWLAIGQPIIDRYDELIRTRGDNEPSFQSFLEKNAQLIDPMALTVWPEPALFGARKPDFVVRRADDTYLIVEIEVPSKLLMTAGNQLSAEATHAMAQATDYRQFLMRRFATAAQHFPKFREPDCLVVIGLESELNPEQQEALERANHSFNRIRIVGFDWIAQRARAVARNSIEALAAERRVRVM